MANDNNKNQEQGLDREQIQELMDNQEDTGQSVDRKELLETLEEMKSEMGQEGDTEQFAEIGRAIQQLKGLQEEDLTPNMYKDILGDLFNDFQSQQTSLFGSLASKIGGLSETVGNKVSNVFNRGNINTQMQEQVDQSKQMVQNINENADKNINKQEILGSLEEMKSELSRDQDEEMLGEIGKAINQLKSFEEENLTPEQYKPIVGDLFEEATEEQSGILRSMLSEVGGLNETMQSGFGRITGVIGDAFSPLMELKELGIGLFETLKGGFEKVVGVFSYLRGQSREESQQTGILGSIKRYMRDLAGTQEEQLQLDQRQYKRKLRTGGDEEGGLFSGGMAEILPVIIGGALTALGAAIGASIRSITIPFEVIGRAINKFTPIARWFSGLINATIGILAKIPGGMKILGYFQKLYQWVQGFIQTVRSASGYLGSLVKGLRIGFKVLGWPLIIIMGLIDFVRGFISEQGSIIEKIKAGLQKAIFGFIEMPAKLLGWVSDWILGLFGAEVEGGVGGKITDVIKRTIELITDYFLWPVTAIQNFIQGYQAGEGNFLQKISSGIQQAITALIRIPVSFIGWMVGKIAGWAGKDIEDPTQMVMEKIKKVMDVIFTPIKAIVGAIGSAASFAIDVGQFLGIFDALKTTLFSVFDIILSPFKILWDAVQALWSLAHGDLSSAGEEVKQMFGQLWGMLKSVFNVITWPIRTFIIAPIESLIGWLIGQNDLNLFNWITNTVSNFMSSIGNWFKGLIPSWKSIKSGINAIIQFDLGDWIIDKVSGIASGVWGWFKGFIPSWSEIKAGLGTVISLVQILPSMISGLWSDIKGWFKGLFPSWKSIKSSLKDIASFDLVGFLKQKIQDVWTGIKDFFKDIFTINFKDALSGIGSKLNDMIPYINPFPGEGSSDKEAKTEGGKDKKTKELTKESLSTDIKKKLNALIPIFNPFDVGGGDGDQTKTGPKSVPEASQRAAANIGMSGTPSADSEMEGSRKLGGPISEAGLWNLHQGEYVLPKSTVDRIGDIDTVEKTREREGRERERKDNTESLLQQLINRIEQNTNEVKKIQEKRKEESTGGGTGGSVGAPRTITDPPDEIENIGIMLFNKNWGV